MIKLRTSLAYILRNAKGNIRIMKKGFEVLEFLDASMCTKNLPIINYTSLLNPLYGAANTDVCQLQTLLQLARRGSQNKVGKSEVFCSYTPST